MLDKLSLKILRYIKDHPKVSLSDRQSKFSDNCDSNVYYLFKEEYISNELRGHTGITNTPVYRNIYEILPKGTAYLEELPKIRFFKIYPLVISTIAIIISLISMLKSFGLIFS